MKFFVLVALTALGSLLLIHTLDPPLMTDSVRMPLTILVVTLAALTLFLERWLRPGEGGRPGVQVRKVMGLTMIKMFLMLGIILAYLLAGMPDPKVFGVAAYLVYLSFTGILVAESMRHVAPPTDPR
jgi:hypothetical protein